MLAQNFKTATDLGIDDGELNTLIKVLGMLERREIPDKLFDMKNVGAPDCGTAGCILGWTKVINLNVYDAITEEMPEALQELFYPGLNRPMPKTFPYGATTSQAATALRSYLTTGEADWEMAMSSTK